jgi:hypothetical protein
MKSSNRLSTPAKITIILIILQLAFKVWVELTKSQDLVIDLAIVDSLFWSGTLAWVVLIPLLIQRHRPSYLAASIFGVLNGIIGFFFPLFGVCHHYYVGSFIFVHGMLIAFFGYRAYSRWS